MRIKNFAKSLIAGLMSASVLFSTFPIGVQAAQVNEYVDPADIWVSANGRTNELDFNATITQETGWCPVCNKDTIMLTYRTPEYTKSGSTALNRGVKYSDGTMVDGETVGNLDSGRPNQDASYTTYHWTKSVCQTCGTINSIDGENDYAFSRNVYGLNSCDHNFFLDFDNTTYEPYSSTKHTTVAKEAGVSKATLYNNAMLKERILGLRTSTKGVPNPENTVTAAERTTNKGYLEEIRKLRNDKKKLILQLVEMEELREENARLREQVQKLLERGD